MLEPCRTHSSPTNNSPIRRINIRLFSDTFPINRKQFLPSHMVHIQYFMPRSVKTFIPAEKFETIPELMTRIFSIMLNGDGKRSISKFPNPRVLNNPTMSLGSCSFLCTCFLTNSAHLPTRSTSSSPKAARSISRTPSGNNSKWHFDIDWYKHVAYELPPCFDHEEPSRSEKTTSHPA